MSKSVITMLIIISVSNIVTAQSRKFKKYSGNKSFYETIDKTKLNVLLNNRDSKVNYIAIFTNDCPGTHYLLNDIKEYVKKYGDGVNIILASSERYKGIPGLNRKLKKYGINLSKVYVIDSDLYKDKRLDSREKGYQFRNDICVECRNDIIGVPYSIVFDNARKVLYHGYDRNPVDSIFKLYTNQ